VNALGAPLLFGCVKSGGDADGKAENDQGQAQRGQPGPGEKHDQ
jgi:hypothetical protein